MLKKANKNQKAVFHVLQIAVIEFLWALIFHGLFHRMGWLASAEDASFRNAVTLLWQTALFMVPAISHLILSLIEHRKNFFAVYGLQLPERRLRWIPLTIGALYAGMVITAAVLNKHAGYTVFLGVFLLVFSGILEEFIFRGLMDEHMQHHEKKWIQWILPALLFMIVRLAGPLAQEKLHSAADWIHILLEAGFFFSIGILMKYSKRVSGTLITPVFLLSMIEFFELAQNIN